MPELPLIGFVGSLVTLELPHHILIPNLLRVLDQNTVCKIGVLVRKGVAEQGVEFTFPHGTEGDTIYAGRLLFEIGTVTTLP